MNNLEPLLPTDQTGEILRPSDAIQRWQKKILQTVLLLAILLGVVFVFQALPLALSTNNWILFIIILLITVSAIALILFRRISFRISSLGVCLIFLLFGNVAFLRGGWSWLSLILLLVFSFLCTALLKKKYVVIGLGIGIITLFTWLFFASKHKTASIETLSNAQLLIDVLLLLISGFLINLLIISMRKKLLQEYVLIFDAQEKLNLAEKEFSIKKSEIENGRLQMQVLSGVLKIATSTIDVQLLLKYVADLLRERLSLYFVGIFLIDQSGEYAVLQYGTGESGRQMLTSSYRLTVHGQSLIGKSIQSKQPKLSSVIDPETEFIENPFLPESKWEIAIPIVNGNDVFGALSVHSIDLKGFDELLQVILQESAKILSFSLEKNSPITMPHRSTNYALPISRYFSTTPSRDVKELMKETEFTFENPLAIKGAGESIKVQLPLMLRDTRIGSIDLEIEGKELTNEQTDFLQAITAQTAIALENASLLGQSLQQAKRERKVMEIASKIRSTNDSKKMLQITLEELSRVLGVSKAQIVLNVPERPQENPSSETDTMSLDRKKRTTGELHEL